MARLGEQYGPQFLQDVAAKLLVELAEAVERNAAERGVAAVDVSTCRRVDVLFLD